MFKKLDNPEKSMVRSRAKANILLFIFEFLSLSLAMIFNIENLTNMDFYTYAAILLVTVLVSFLVDKFTKSDNILLLIVNMLFSIGVAIIYRLDPKLGRRQLQFYLAGVVLFFLTYYILKSFKFWDKLILFYAGVSIVLFILTLVFGTYLGGAKNWIVIKNIITIQPSEFIKVPLAFFIASFYVNFNKISLKPFGRYFMNFIIYVFIGFLFLQKDLGTALIFFGTLIVSQFVYEKDRRLIFINMFFMIIGSIVAYFLFGHVRIRVSLSLIHI